MPEPGAGARPPVGPVGDRSGLRTAEGVALGFDFGTKRIGLAVALFTKWIGPNPRFPHEVNRERAPGARNG